MTDGGRAFLAEETVARVVRPEICALSAYAVAKTGPDASEWVKLDAMESPYPLPDTVKARLSAALARVAINRYPDASGEGAKRVLALRRPTAALWATNQIARRNDYNNTRLPRLLDGLT